MGRVSRVPAEEAISVIRQFIEYFRYDKLPKYSDDVWERMSACLNGRWKARDVYREVREDRRRILTKAKQLCRLTKDENNITNNDTDYINCDEDSDSYCSEMEVLLDESELTSGKEPNVKMKNEDVLNNIEAMRYTDPYNDFIHDLRRDEFYVFYSTVKQVNTYERYHQSTKISRISIGRIGNSVSKIDRIYGGKSGPIFMYAIIINDGKSLNSIYHMLTECLGVSLIEYWFRQWLQLNVSKPTEVSCHCSRALINALSLAFNKQTVKVYMDTLFFLTSKHDAYYSRPGISTYIRIDATDFIKIIKNWNSFQCIKFKSVRKFYLHSLALMIDAQSLSQFQDIFLLMSIVALHTYEDTIIRYINNSRITVKAARLKLMEIMESRQFEFISNDDCDDIAAKIDDTFTSLMISNDDSSPRIQWVNNIRLMADNCIKHRCDDVNPYFSKVFLDQFMKLAYEFPLWSAACLPHKSEPGNAKNAEEFLNDKLQRYSQDNPGGLNADVLLKLEYINGV